MNTYKLSSRKLLVHFLSLILILTTSYLAFGNNSSNKNQMTFKEKETINTSVCEAVGCQSGIQRCAIVRIPDSDNPVDKVYICNQSTMPIANS